MFKDEHPEVKISIRMFEQLKPTCVRRLKERNTCCCVKHEQAELYRKAFSVLRSKFHANCTCSCGVCAADENNGVCQAPSKTFENVSAMWRATVCDKEGEEWHSLDCVKGECQSCGTENIQICPKEKASQNENIEWQVYKYVNEPSKAGISRRLKLVTEKGSPGTLLDKMFLHLTKFTIHNFSASWQSKQFRKSVQTLRDDSVLSVMDFAENYTLQPLREVQSEHWNNDQITILVHITMMKVKGELKKTVHLYVSDVMKHDAFFVQAALKIHHIWMMQKGFGHIKYHVMWSDGCAAQFKCSRAFYLNVAQYYNRYKIRMQWNYFGSGHGKGEHDGQAALEKRFLADEQRKEKGVPILGANSACTLLRQKKCKMDRVIWEVMAEDINRDPRSACETLPGTLALHSVSAINPADPTLVMYRSLSCFCNGCLNFRWGECENLQHCGAWKLHKLEPSSVQLDEQEELVGFYAADEQELSEVLQIGDIFASFAAPGNHENVPYFILLCVKVEHILQEDVIDDYGNSMLAGDRVIAGHYYQLLQGTKHKYKFVDDKIVLVPAESVIGAKFTMQQVKHKLKGARTAYTLTREVHDMLISSLPEIVECT